MTRLPLVMGHLRTRIVAKIGVGVAVVLAAEHLANQALLDLSPAQLRLQSFGAITLAGVFLAAMGLDLSARLHPITALLRRLGAPDHDRASGAKRVETAAEDTDSDGVAEKRDGAARAAALRMPLGSARFGLQFALLLITVKLALDLSLCKLSLGVAVALAIRLAALAIGGAMLYHLLARRWMRPIIANFLDEAAPVQPRVSLFTKIASSIIALALAVAVPLTTTHSARMARTAAAAQDHYHHVLAQVIAHGATELPPDRLRDTIAAMRLPGLRIRFSDRPRLASARLPAVQRAKYLQISNHRAPPRFGAMAPLLLCLSLIAFALIVAAELGTRLAADVRAMAERVSTLASSPTTTPAQALQPIEAQTPQHRDLRALAAALNGILDRMVEMQVSHFVATEKTLEAAQLRTQFLASMSHDLRSPLNAVLGFSELLLRGADDSLTDGQRTAIETILRSGNELLRLINQVLDSAKLEANRMQVHRVPSLPIDIVTRAIRDVQQRGVVDSTTFETQLQAGLPAIHVDTPLVIDAMANVLHFCAQAAPGEAILIRAAATSDRSNDGADRQLVLSVSDSSPRVTNDDSVALFSGFRRRPGQRGLGLELPLARAFVELHGGSLVLERGGHRGNTFVISLPFAGQRTTGRLRPIRV